MIPIEIRGVRIGAGRPKICVPITGKTYKEILDDAAIIVNRPCDMAEWRADWFEDVFNLEQTIEVLKELRQILDKKPLLFTFRTLQEGGEKAISVQEYVALLKAVSDSHLADLVDIELFPFEQELPSLISYVHKTSGKVILSSHDFQKTPTCGELLKCLEKMEELGADISKIAVMPQSRKDVLTLLSVTEERSRHALHPVITMSMSETGLISRLAGEVFGSAVTFGSVTNASAPGQIPVEQLSRVLDILHGGKEE